MQFLFNRTENTTVIKYYHVLIESFIGLFAFSIFFYVFMIYFFMDMETSYLVAFIKKSISYYKIISVPQNYKLPKYTSTDTTNLDEYNNSYDKKFLIIVAVFISIILSLIIIPLLLGIIRIKQLDITYISLSLLIHFIILIGVELIFLYCILPYFNPLKLYKLFDEQLEHKYTK